MKGTLNGSQVYHGTKASRHDPGEIPGVDFGSRVITEVHCSPPPNRTSNGGLGFLSKLTGRFRRHSHHHTGSGHMRSQHGNPSGEEIELHAQGESGRVVVSYDVWRTVEDKKGEDGDSFAVKGHNV